MGGKTLNNSYVFLAEDEGQQTVTASYTEGELTKTTTFDINVTAGALVVDTIVITTLPTVRVYEVGQTFSSTGLVVTANYEGGGSANVSADVTFDMEGTNPVAYTFLTGDIGIKTVTASYEGKDAIFDIEVFEVPNNTWRLAPRQNAARAPGNVIYNPGNAFNDGGTYRIYVHFPALGTNITNFKIEFETTGNITVQRQCMYNATGTAGWGSGDVTSGANISLTGAGDWYGFGDLSNTSGVNAFCFNIIGAGASGEWSFRLTDVTLEGESGGGEE